MRGVCFVCLITFLKKICGSPQAVEDYMWHPHNRKIIEINKQKKGKRESERKGKGKKSPKKSDRPFRDRTCDCTLAIITLGK